MFGRLRISTKLLLTTLPLALLAVGTSVYVNNLYESRDMLQEARISAETYAEIIRESLVHMMVKQQRVDDHFLDRLTQIPDIPHVHVHFVPDSLRLIGLYARDAGRLERLEDRYRRASKLEPEEQEVFRTGVPNLQRRGNVFTAVVPFRADERCQTCHDVPTGTVLGAAKMGINLERFSKSMSENWMRSIAIYALFATVAIAISILVYRSLVDRRLRSIVDATQTIGSGNLDTPVAADPSGDELGELSEAVESMRGQLKKTQQDLIHAERLSMIGQMASSIVHDLRTPMTTVNFAIDRLAEGERLSPEHVRHLYGVIRSSINRMLVMAQELLDYSRGEARLNRVDCSLEAFVADLVQSIDPTLRRANVELCVEEHYRGHAVFDPDRLQQALVNIINNAQEAMPHGGIVLVQTNRANSSVLFSISDTGPGIPPEIRARIFEPFVTAGKRRGTGLGLAITKRIVDQHGGMIDIESEQGKGTRFVIRIPIGTV